MAVRSGISGRCNLVLLLVLGLFSSELLPEIMAAPGSKVDYLPGLQHQGPLPFELQTGYIGVGEGDEVQVFYYFINSESDPTSDPILMWISGGPGCSTLFAFLNEFGPVNMDLVAYNGSLPTLSLNPYSWSKRGVTTLILSNKVSMQNNSCASGDHDSLVPHIGTKAWIESLNYSIVDEWRAWIVDGIAAGYTRSYSNNMTFATVKGSGHVAPFFTPSECFAMFRRWISGERL
nr:hypothetical protein EUTSA_v10000306mg [Ipomoea trifida]